MPDFQLDAGALADQLCQAQAVASGNQPLLVLERVRNGHTPQPEELGLLWFAPQIESEALYALACERHPARQLETFSPLYMTNTCDAECRMCGMRRDNTALKRETAPIAAVIEQLRLLQGRGMLAVALLTGEYRIERRAWALDYVNQALRATQELGFRHVLINVGAIDDAEFATLLQGMARRSDGALSSKITMCTFQEAYSRTAYSKFMGSDADNPRADYARRLANFDRAFHAGMRVANPGILVGLNPDLAFELTALVTHARHLLARGMEVYLSVPRLRQIAGSANPRGASDERFVRLVSLLSLALPTCKIVITTREDSVMQAKLAPIVTVISAGSAAVAPYTSDGARFPLEMSQFEVIDQRPFEAVLRDHGAEHSVIQNFEPPRHAA